MFFIILQLEVGRKRSVVWTALPVECFGDQQKRGLYKWQPQVGKLIFAFT